MAIMEDSSGNRKAFDAELEQLINRHSMENNSNTPDFILAEYLSLCLHAFDKATNQRTKWFAPGGPDTGVCHDAESRFVFCAKGEEIMKFAPNGDIFIRGKLVTNDIEVVDAMREWLKLAKVSRSDI